MDGYETVVIGAGVVGLACARALAAAGQEVLIVEREASFGSVTSARSSEVIHAGLYYPPGSLRARLCVRGRDLLYAFCAERGVAHQRCGKLVVATHTDELKALQGLQSQAQACGVSHLRWLSRRDVQTLEPALAAEAALLSPDTGIVDSHGLMLALLGEAEAHGAMLLTRHEVCGLSPAEGGWQLQIRSPKDGPSRDVSSATTGGRDTASDIPLTLSAKHVVNAAGLQAPALAARTAGLPTSAQPKAWFAQGAYAKLQGRAPFRHLIYPVPGASSHLGVHLTLDLGGQARFGPSFRWVDGEDYRIDPAEIAQFEAAVRRYWPGLPEASLLPDYAGVRPKISGPGAPAADFRIDGPAEHGLPGLINLFGIESPGLTAALALAEEVAHRFTASR